MRRIAIAGVLFALACTTQDLGTHADAGLDAGDGGTDAGGCARGDIELGSALGRMVYRGTTENAGNDYDFACYDGADYEDLALHWVAPFTGRYWFQSVVFAAPPENVVLEIQRTCGGEVLACGGDPRLPERLEDVELEQGDDLMLVIDSLYPATGPVRFALGIAGWPRIPETLCSDGKDNDGDGATDSADGDCVDARTETECANWFDDDLDELVDCADPDCLGPPTGPPSACPWESDCFNGVDDDFNGLTDCDDPSCDAGEWQCQEKVCDDGLDNDGDGAVDCAECGGGFCDEYECWDGLDNDGDGRIDCEEQECAYDLACIVDPCPARDLGTELGAFPGTFFRTGQRDNGLHQGSCVPIVFVEPQPYYLGRQGPEVTHLWTAPHAGTYRFSTERPSVPLTFDTALYVLDRCQGGTELGCSDDEGPGQYSMLDLTLAAGQSVVVVVQDVSRAPLQYYYRRAYVLRIEEM